MTEESLVHFQCVKDGGKLRIRITSPGYNNLANCQFPREIRKEGGLYSAPISAINFAKGPAGKFFYRVSKNKIKVIDGETSKVTINKIFEDEIQEECLVCMDNKHDVVIVPCGHFCVCKSCAENILKTTKKCPICRGTMSLIVTKDQIQM